MYEDICVMNFVFRQDIFDYFLVEVSQSFGTVQFDTAEFGWRDADLRGVFVQPNPHFLQLSANFDFLLLCLSRLNNQQNHIWILSDCDNLPSSTLSVSSALDDTRQIQELDFCVVVVDYTWNAGQGCEFVGCWKRRCIGDAGKESWFADWGEADHADSCVSESADLETFSWFSFGGRLQKLRPVFGQFGL